MSADVKFTFNDLTAIPQADIDQVIANACSRNQRSHRRGAERNLLMMNAVNKTVMAYHEAGHVIASRLVLERNPVEQASIAPDRHFQLPAVSAPNNRYATRRGLDNRIAALLGGRAAEDLVFGGAIVTIGAQRDLERAIAIARHSAAESAINLAITNNYRRVRRLLANKLPILHLMAEVLLQYETLDRAQIDAVMAGREPQPQAA